jgi:RimJ/RimL family protein N-acetyltransferase
MPKPVLPRPVLHTARLLLRPLGPSDAPAVGAAVVDPELLHWFPAWVGAGPEDVADRVGRGDEPDALTLAVTVGGSFAGQCWLSRVDPVNGTAAAGYWLAPQARGHGYAAEALQTLAGWAFAELGLHRLEAAVAEPNVASLRVALRAGFQPEGVRRRAVRAGNEQVDVRVFSRLRDDPPGPAPRLLPDVRTLSDGVVVLRPLVAADADDCYAERRDPEVQRWAVSPVLADRAELRRQAAAAPARWLVGTEARFVVQDAGAYAGQVSLRVTEPGIRLAMVGYSLLAAHRGRGLMQRALRLVTRWAFDEAGLARLEAGVAVDNVASLRTAEGAGFRREGVLRQALPGSAGRFDMVLLAVLPDDLRR